MGDKFIAYTGFGFHGGWDCYPRRPQPLPDRTYRLVRAGRLKTPV